MSRVWTLLVGGVVAVLVGFGSGDARADCVAGVARGDSLRIRTGPGVQHGETGGIPPGACGVRVTGGCRGQWCPVSWNGRHGWSNGNFLTRETREVRPAPVWSPFASLFAPPPPPPRFVPQPSPRKVAAPEPKAGPEPEPVKPLVKRAAPPAATVAASAMLPPPQPQATPPTARDATAPAPAGDVREVCVRGIAKGDTLKVRAGPGASSELRYGYLPDTCGVKINGACKGGWCPVDYRGYKGWAEQRNLQ